MYEVCLLTTPVTGLIVLHVQVGHVGVTGVNRRTFITDSTVEKVFGLFHYLLI